MNNTFNQPHSLQTNTQITGSCIISNHTVYLNNNIVYQQQASEVSQLLTGIYQHFQLSYPKFYKMDQLSKLGWLAAELLLQEQELSVKYTPEQVGLVLSNASSSLDADLRYTATMNEAASPALFVYTLPNIVIGEISIRHKLKGENAFFISPHFNAGLIESQVNLLMDNQLLQVCICGWVELLGQEYKAALFLVEKDSTGSSADHFSAANLNQLFNAANE